jgi:hypothetical protein
LKNICFYGLGDDEPIAGFLQKELNLREITFRYLNFDSHGMSFSRTHELRPKLRMYDAHSLLGEEGWASVERGDGTEGCITLSSADGDDVKHWLGVIDRKWQMMDEWDWEGYTWEIRELM